VFYASQGGVIQYQAKNNVINQVNPGVFFYYTGASKDITNPGPVCINQSRNSTSLIPFAPVQNGIMLFLVTGGTCTSRTAISSVFLNGTVCVTIPPPALSPPSYYVISVKYDAGTQKGQNSAGTPTVQFTFKTTDNNQENGRVVLAPK
jgi:hypothetical protein